MFFNVQSNAVAVVEALRRKAEQTPLAVKKSLVDATNVLFTESLNQLAALVYNRPIPAIKRWRRLKEKNGSWRSAAKATKGQKSFFGMAHSARQSAKKAWKRTSTLRRNERAYFDKLSAFETKIDNATPYATARHNLKRASRYDYDNEAPWRQRAHDNKGAQAEATFRDALAAQLNSE